MNKPEVKIHIKDTSNLTRRVTEKELKEECNEVKKHLEAIGLAVKSVDYFNYHYIITLKAGGASIKIKIE